MSNAHLCENSHVIFPFPGSLTTKWNQRTQRGFQNFTFWDFQRNQNFNLSYLDFSSPCTWSCVWKLAHHTGCQLRLPPPHPHVLLPLQPVFCRHLLHLHHHPKDAVEHPDTEQSHNLWRLHHPGVFFHTLCRTWHLAPNSDGLWSLHGHLPPPALHGHHEPPALWTAYSDILYVDYLVFLATQLNVVWLSFCTVVQIPHFLCELSQVVQHASSDNFLNNIWCIFQLSWWVVVLLLVSFTLTLK